MQDTLVFKIFTQKQHYNAEKLYQKLFAYSGFNQRNLTVSMRVSLTLITSIS